MSTPKHTPKHTQEPLSVTDGVIRNSSGELIAAMDMLNTDQEDEFGNHIVACVNALAGLNPEAIKDVVEALEAADKAVEDIITIPRPSYGEESNAFENAQSRARDVSYAIEAALRKLKEGQQ